MRPDDVYIRACKLFETKMEYFHYLVSINEVQKSLFKISVLHSEYFAKYEARNMRYEMLVKAHFLKLIPSGRRRATERMPYASG